ncbi:uncharacterized protein LOC130922431 [Corythoichthys intestinalis]|uniref:uncharacterized protein LOC130922431 n=1 Tax=Corythoichthys intestinalis TaxID=161448 RepID=UPI0025A57138|nr:uncharacterized protein LOC130922431 [Corythoichthys intestinalis]
MFKNVSSEAGLPGGRSLASSAGLGASPAGLAAQESSWLGLLSVLSRPAFAFVSRYLPGLGGSGSGSVMESVVREQGELLCQLEATSSSLSWFNDSSLCQLGIDAVAPGPGPSRKDQWWGGSYGAVLRSAHLACADPHFFSPQIAKLTIEPGGDLLCESTGTDVPREEASGGHGEASLDQDNGYYSLEEEHGLRGQDRTESETPDRLPDQQVEGPVVPEEAPRQCRNVSIAFIMGCPFSDDDSSQSDGDSDSMDDSDSWDDLSDEDEETARLLASLCHRDDPYNPQNFSARLHTGRTPLTDRDASQPESSTLSDPSVTLDLRLPLGTGKARASEVPNGDFPKPLASAKKVRFSDVVEEFLIVSDGGEEEDRRGPWEELARDRGRFLRRCQEAELTLAYCLQPEHRRTVYSRINGHEDP